MRLVCCVLLGWGLYALVAICVTRCPCPTTERLIGAGVNIWRVSIGGWVVRQHIGLLRWGACLVSDDR